MFFHRERSPCRRQDLKRRFNDGGRGLLGDDLESEGERLAVDRGFDGVGALLGCGAHENPGRENLALEFFDPRAYGVEKGGRAVDREFDAVDVGEIEFLAEVLHPVEDLSKAPLLDESRCQFRVEDDNTRFSRGGRVSVVGFQADGDFIGLDCDVLVAKAQSNGTRGLEFPAQRRGIGLGQRFF